MTVIKESIPLEAELSGEGRQRTCRIRVSKRTTYADESALPLCVSYCRCEIVDPDDFPDGNYELRFEGRSVQLKKHRGQYGVY